MCSSNLKDAFLLLRLKEQNLGRVAVRRLIETMALVRGREVCQFAETQHKGAQTQIS